VQLIQRFVWLIGQTPYSLKAFAAKAVSLYLIYIPNKFGQITQKNVQLAYPEMSEQNQRHLVKNSLCELCLKFFDLITTWVRPVSYSKDQVLLVHGFDEFAMKSKGRPTLVLLPHIGNWELFGVWLSHHRSYTAMFRPLRLPDISGLVRSARERNGNYLVPATTAGVRQMLKRLRQSEMAIVLPDQVPKEGDGLYIPFFGHEVITPVLPYRLAASTDAVVFLGAALKRDKGYEIVLKELSSPSQFDSIYWLGDMNREIEMLVRDYPEQYQWEYRRFRNAPDGTLRYP
jgi:KDO2-lipid IV(A) lauroyltransferase